MNTSHIYKITLTLLIILIIPFKQSYAVSIEKHDASNVLNILQFNTNESASYIALSPSGKAIAPPPNTSHMRFLDFRSGKFHSLAKIKQSPIVSPLGVQSGTLALPQLDHDLYWELFTINSDLTELKEVAVLEGLSVASITLTHNAAYYVGGMSKQGHPVLIRVDPATKKAKIFNFSQSRRGTITDLFPTNDSIMALASFDDSSVFFKISETLEPQYERFIEGTVSSAVLLGDGSLIVASMLLPGPSIQIEKFDTNGASRWKQKLYQISHDSVNSGVKLSKTSNGIAIAGFHENALLIGRISLDGTDLQLKRFSEPGIFFDALPSSFFINTFGHEISIWALGMDFHSKKKIIIHIRDI